VIEKKSKKFSTEEVQKRMRKIWRLPKMKGRDTDSDQSTSQQEQESKENEKLQAVFARSQHHLR
jgi:hypothetical protein